MLHRTLRGFWWPMVATDIKGYEVSCHKFRRAKPQHQKPAGLLWPLETPSQPSYTMSLDVSQVQDYNSILVVVYLFNKLVYFAPCKGLPRVRETIQLFLDHVFCYGGLVPRLIFDRKSQFTSRFWMVLFSF